MKVQLLFGAVATLALVPGGPVSFDEVPAGAMSRVAVGPREVVYAISRDGESQLRVREREPGAGGDALLMQAPRGLRVMSPALSPDGRTLYFESNVREPAVPGREDTDIWMAERTVSGWRTPRPLGAPFDSPYNEHFPAVDATGGICFNSARPGSRENDIYCGRLGSGEAPRPLDAVNSAAEDASASLAPSGNVLVFASNREGGLGGWDLYVSRKTAAGWSAAGNLGAPINSPDDEFGVSLFTRGDRMVYGRSKPGGGERRILSAPFALGDR